MRHDELDLATLKAELILDEGLRTQVYTDTVGKLTIGIGHNLTDKGLSSEIIDRVYEEDIEEVITGLSVALPWFRALDGVRKRVLVNMAFNLGVRGLLTFRNTLRAIEGGEYQVAAIGMRESLWYEQVGKRAERLAKMMETGEA